MSNVVPLRPAEPVPPVIVTLLNLVSVLRESLGNDKEGQDGDDRE